MSYKIFALIIIFNAHIFMWACSQCKSSCIDQIISNIPNATTSVLPLHLSDHETAQLISIPTKIKRLHIAIYYTYKGDYNLDNIRKFRQCLQSLYWSDIHSENDLNLAFNEFHELFCLLYNLCFPKMQVKVSLNKKDRQNWISWGLKQSSKTKRTLRYKYYKNKTMLNKIKYTMYSKLLKSTMLYLKIQ